MKSTFRLSLPFSAGLAFLLLGCAAKTDSESLSLNAFPASLKVGDTTEVFSVTKKSRDSQGRMQTNSAYTNFYLVSEDTTVIRIYQNRRMIAMAEGNTQVTAQDAGGSLSSAKYAVAVGP